MIRLRGCLCLHMTTIMTAYYRPPSHACEWWVLYVELNGSMLEIKQYQKLDSKIQILGSDIVH